MGLLRKYQKKINHLGRKTAHRKSMLANMACSLKNIKTENILLSTKIINSFYEIRNEFKNNQNYLYIQIDPFFRKKNFAISFREY